MRAPTPILSSEVDERVPPNPGTPNGRKDSKKKKKKGNGIVEVHVYEGEGHIF
jgi:hypothetical protein